jgi:hypothetical protein
MKRNESIAVVVREAAKSAGVKIVDKSGKEILPDNLMKELAAGNVRPDVMQAISRQIYGNLPPEAVKPDTVAGPAGKSGEAPAIGGDAADGLIGAGGGLYAGILAQNDPDKKALDAYTKTKENKKSTQKQKDDALKAAQGALGRISAAIEGKGDAAYTAATATDLTAIQGAVDKRRAQLKKANITDEKTAKILHTELGSQEIAANIEKQSVGTKKLDDLIGQSAATAPAPAATEVAPAGGAPKAKPKAAPAGGAAKAKTKATPPAEPAGPPAPTAPAAPLSSSITPTAPIPAAPAMWTGTAEEYWKWDGTAWVPKG